MTGEREQWIQIPAGAARVMRLRCAVIAIAVAGCGRSEPRHAVSARDRAVGSGSAADGRLPPQLVCSGRWVGTLPPRCASLGDLVHFDVTVRAKGSAWEIAVAEPAGTRITSQDVWWSATAGGCRIELGLEHDKRTADLTLTNGVVPGALTRNRHLKRPELTGAAPPKGEAISADDVGCHGEFDVAFTPDDGAVPVPDPAWVALARAYTPTVTWSETVDQDANQCGIALPERLAFHVTIDPREGNALRADDLDLLALFGDQALDERITANDGGLFVEQTYVRMDNVEIDSSAKLSIKGSDGSVLLQRLRTGPDGKATRCDLLGHLHQDATP